MSREAILTRAQAAVLAELACDGATNLEIAERLGVTIDTVKAHMKAILVAFDRKDRAAVVADYLRRRVVVTVVKYRADGALK